MLMVGKEVLSNDDTEEWVEQESVAFWESCRAARANTYTSNYADDYTSLRDFRHNSIIVSRDANEEIKW